MVVVLQIILLLTCTALIFGVGFSDGELRREFKTLNVDKSNPSSFSTIQKAIDSVPSNNTKWIIIAVKPGTYPEQVKISSDKPFIYLKGEVGKTWIVWGSSTVIIDSATFDSSADNILVTGFTFVKYCNHPPYNNGNPVKGAVAAKISGDKSALYDCSFLGYENTVYDHGGRHYFKNCNITGAVDFIFGNGQSIYEGCRLTVDVGGGSNVKGYIAAQGREDPNDGSGFVFKNCNVNGNGKMYLGRAWRPYSRVIYYRCFLPDGIIPQGWDSWGNAPDKLTFAEEECCGAGSDKSQRVKWEKTLTKVELHSFTSISYIDNEGWISRLPLH